VCNFIKFKRKSKIRLHNPKFLVSSHVRYNTIQQMLQWVWQGVLTKMIWNDMEFLAHLGDTLQTNGMITYHIFEIFTTWKNKHYQLTVVNSANILDEGLMIGGRGRQMNSKIKIRQTMRGLMCIENKCSTQLTQSRSVRGRPLLTPLYRWPGLEEPVGFNIN
jgi:hypothetical protein